MKLTAARITDFQSVVRNYYVAYGRHDMPWRQPKADGSFDPYKILVSELMLQQTQVNRAMPKYHQFLELFPTVEALASSSLSVVLTAWSGLGYNRRAKFLHQAAKKLVNDYGGTFPQDIAELVTLPGVGKNTAGAILAYAFNQPVVFIETNIRTVYIRHFFYDQAGIADSEILPLVAATLPQARGKRAARDDEFISSPGAMRKTVGLSHYRTWYWSLMDYGAHLKQTTGNLNKLSMHYSRQSRFEGSRRQVRGQVIRTLTLAPYDLSALQRLIPDERLAAVLADLQAEGLIRQDGTRYTLSE